MKFTASAITSVLMASYVGAYNEIDRIEESKGKATTRSYVPSGMGCEPVPLNAAAMVARVCKTNRHTDISGSYGRTSANLTFYLFLPFSTT